MKKAIRKVKHVGFTQAKKFLKDKPKTKKTVIRTIRAVEKVTGTNILERNHSYTAWLKNHTPSKEVLLKQQSESSSFAYQPLISIITPVYDTPKDLLVECIESVLNQSYQNWQLIFVDDCSPKQNTRDILTGFTNKDSRIKTIFNKKNMHIANATNVGIQNANGEYIGFLDHDDVLYPHALYSVAKELNNKKHDFIYSDEDKLTANGKRRLGPFFKPDWSPDYLRSINYITHFVVIKKSLIKKVGGLDPKYNGAQDWDLFLRTTRQAKSIYHIQDVLYGWRMTANSTAQETDAKPYTVAAQKSALEEDVKARGYTAKVQTSRYIKDYWEVNYTFKGGPMVSIVIPTKNQYKVVRRCIDSILQKSTYINYEIVLVDTGSTEKDVLNWYETLKNNMNVHMFSWVEPKFSYANSCNFGAVKAKGEYLIMLNNDTEVITPNWIELMLGDAQRDEVGTVGAKLFFPGNEYIQHAGIGLGLGGYAANILGGSPDQKLNSLQRLYADNKRNVAANTAACIMIRKKMFEEVGGFDKEFSVTYSDVDLGLQILKHGYLNVYNPAVVLTHHESISLGLPEEAKRDSKEFTEGKELLKMKWPDYVAHDPYLNDNYSKDHANFTIKR